jgi:O-antigen/teichoic acid export membrane protein
VLPLAVTTAAYLIQDFMRRYFFARSNNRLALLCDALSYLTQLPILWWQATQHVLTIPRAYWIIGLTSLFSMLVSCVWVRGLRFSLAALPSVLRRNSKLVRWLVPSAALQWASLNLFMIFAPIYYGAAAAGALRACQNLVAVAHVWFLGLENVIPPEAAEQLHSAGVDSLMRYLRKVALRWGLITALFMAIVSIAPAFWLNLLYGPRYTEFGYVLRFYGLLYVLIFLGGPLRAGLQAIEFTAPLLWSYGAMAAFAAVMAAPMAKHFGLSGVMLGLIATQLIFQAILGLSLVMRTKRIREFDQVIVEARV